MPALSPQTLSYDDLKHLLVRRQPDTSKGDYGHVLVIGGDEGFGGAVLLAAQAAARCGAGLVSIATHPVHATASLPACPELMCRGINQPKELRPLLDKATTLVLGPGLGQSAWSQRIFSFVMEYQEKHDKPMVIDADGLNLISQGVCRDITGELGKCVYTPHPGEAGRLLGCSTADIQADRSGQALALQQSLNGVVVLKGSGSKVAWYDDTGQHLACCSQGNPGMATGGMGDVLSGVIAALMAQQLKPADAATLGVCMHALAGDLAAEEKGERGLLASDLYPWLRKLANPEL